MKNLIFIAIVAFLVGCTTVENGQTKVDPLATGEVIGYTYLLTKDELKDTDRQAIELAYSVFTDVIQEHGDIVKPNDNVKSLMLVVIDSKFDGPSKQKQKVAVKMIVSMYWDRLQTKYNIDSMVSSEQIAFLRQVHMGIERALGR